MCGAATLLPQNCRRIEKLSPEAEGQDLYQLCGEVSETATRGLLHLCTGSLQLSNKTGVVHHLRLGCMRIADCDILQQQLLEL